MSLCSEPTIAWGNRQDARPPGAGAYSDSDDKCEYHFQGLPLKQMRPLENLLDAQHEFMTRRAILRFKLLITVGK